MTLTKFKEMVKLLREDDADSEEQGRLYIQPEMKDKLNKVISILLESHFGEEGEEMISWWLYEKVKKYIYNNEGEKIKDLTTIEALYEYLNEIKIIPDTKNKVVN